MSAYLEWIAVALGLAYVVLAVAQWRSCWLAGGISAAIFLILFWQAALPTQALLQIYYVVVAVHGWWHWGRSDGGEELATVHSWRLRWHLPAIAAVTVVATLTLWLRDVTPGVNAILDASTGWGSAIATWMVARKVLEAWLYWIVIDAAAVVMYAGSDLPVTAGLYALYTIIALGGWIQWRRDLRRESAP